MGASQSVPAAAPAQAAAQAAAPSGKCPVDHSKMAAVGDAGKCPVDHSKMAAAPGGAAGAGAGQCPVDHSKMASAAPAGKCPVDHGKAAAAPKGAGAAPAKPAAEGGQCPMGYDSPDAQAPKSAADAGPVYNVYGQEINPRNMMPSLAQKPAPGQKEAISTHRVKSSIPKGGTDSETWLYPSPQQFYNALVRKDKAGNVSEGDMEHVVAIHNAMNERAWGLLRDWERRFHGDTLKPGCPKLRRFMGKPFEPSPKARLKSLLGLGDPFDRHDWFVDRGDGTEVRYVLDYYYDERVQAADPDPKSTKCIHVDVRPAVDSPAAVWERLAAFPGRALDAVRNFKTFADGTDPDAVPEKFTVALGGGGNRKRSGDEAPDDAPAGTRAREAADRLSAMDRKCHPLRVRLEEAGDDEARQSAFIGLTYCLGTVACPAESGAFMRAVEGGADEAQSEAFASMQQCVVGKMEADVTATKAAERA